MARMRSKQETMQEREGRMDESWSALNNATARLSRDHAQVPETTEDIEDLLFDLNDSRSCVDAFFSASTAYLYASTLLSSDAHSTVSDDRHNRILTALDERRDKLDREGVMLWNRSSSLRHLMSDRTVASETSPDSNREYTLLSAQVIATMRFTAVRLIHAGTPYQSASILEAHTDSHAESSNKVLSLSTCDLIRLLDLYNKTMQEFTACDRLENAEEAYQHAAPLAQMLMDRGGFSDNNGTTLADTKGPLIAFHLARWMMLYKQQKSAASAMELDQAINLLKSGEIKLPHLETIIACLYQGACDLLQQRLSVKAKPRKEESSKEKSSKGGKSDSALEKANAEQVAVWTKQAFRLLDMKIVDKPAAQESRRLRWRIKLLRVLAQCHLTAPSPDFTAAEKAIDELLKLERSFQSCRHKLRLLIKRGAAGMEVDNAFSACLDTMACTVPNVSAMIKEIHQPPASRPKALRQKLTTLVKELIRRGKEDGASCIYLPVVAYCLGLAHSEEDAAAFKSLLHILDGAEDDTVILSSEAAFACQGHLWKLGDHHLKQGNYLLASRWFGFTTERIFSSLDEINIARAKRKIALCLLRADRLQEAREVIQSISGPAASDHYIRFLCGAIGDLEDEAIASMKDMVACSDFQLDMLLWAIKQAQQYAMKGVYRACINQLIDLAKRNVVQDGLSCLALMRTLLKDTREEHQLGEDNDTFLRNVNELVASIVEVAMSMHFHHKSADYLHQIEWFYRTSTKLAVSYIMTDSEEARRLSSLACQLADLYMKAAEQNGGDQAHFCHTRTNAAILRLVPTLVRLQNMEDMLAGRDEALAQLYRILPEIDTFLNTIKLEPLSRVPLDLQASLLAYKFQLLVEAAEWQECMDLLDDCIQWPNKLPLTLFQRFAQVSFCNLQAPCEVTTRTLEVVTETWSEAEGLNIPRLAKLVRAMIASALDRGEYALTRKYLDSALSLLARATDSFPRLEVEWICTVCWNAGMNLAQTDGSVAAEWCEMAMRFGSYIPGYGEQLDLMARHLKLI